MATASEIERMIISIVGDASSYASSLAQAISSTKDFAANVTELFTRLAMSVEAVSVRAFAKFELEMSRIEGLVGVAHTQIIQFSEAVQVMGRTVGKSPQELAEALYFITSAGFKGAEALAVLDASAKAAAAGLGTTKSVADAVTSSVNAYINMNLTASQATDILIAAVREGKMEAASMASVMGRLLPMSSAMGISFADTAGALAAMSKVGATAQDATSSFNSIMMGLQKPTKDGEVVLRAFGLSYDQLRQKIKEPGGIIDVFRMLNKTFGEDVTAMERVFPNIRAVRGILNLLAQDAKSVDDVMKGVRESIGSTNASFKIFESTLAGRFSKAFSAVSSTAIEVGQSLKSILSEIASVITVFAGHWKGLSESTKSYIVTVITLIAILGPARLAVMAVGFSVAGLLVLFRSLVTLIFGPVITAFANLGIAMLAMAAFPAYAAGVVVLSAAILSLTLIAGIGFIALGILISGAYFALKKFDEEVERSKQINTELNDIVSKRQNKIIENAGKLPAPTKGKFLFESLTQAEKQLAGTIRNLNEARDRLEKAKEARGSTGWWVFFGIDVLKQVEGISLEIEEQKTKVGSLTDLIKKLREELEKTGKSTLDKIRIDPKLFTDLRLLEFEMVKQGNSVGKTTSQAKIFDLAVQGLTSSQLAGAKALAQWVIDVEKVQKGMQETKDFTKDLTRQSETFFLSADRVKLYGLRLDGATASQLKAAEAALDLKESLEKLKEMAEEGERVVKEFSSPEEKFAERLQHLNDLYDESFISLSVYNRALDDAIKKFTGGTHEIKKFDAALVGSAESAARWQQYTEMMNPSRIVQIGNRQPLPTGLGNIPGGLKVRTGGEEDFALMNETLERRASFAAPTIPSSAFPPFTPPTPLSGMEIFSEIFKGARDAMFPPENPAEQLLAKTQSILSTIWEGAKKRATANPEALSAAWNDALKELEWAKIMQEQADFILNHLQTKIPAPGEDIGALIADALERASSAADATLVAETNVKEAKTALDESLEPVASNEAEQDLMFPPEIIEPGIPEGNAEVKGLLTKMLEALNKLVTNTEVGVDIEVNEAVI